MMVHKGCVYVMETDGEIVEFPGLFCDKCGDEILGDVEIDLWEDIRWVIRGSTYFTKTTSALEFVGTTTRTG